MIVGPDLDWPIENGSMYISLGYHNGSNYLTW